MGALGEQELAGELGEAAAKVLRELHYARAEARANWELEALRAESR